MITIDVPYPPSANRLWRSARGRVYKDPKYTEWLRQFGLQWLIQKPIGFQMMTGSYQAEMIFAPTRRSGDLDNRQKAMGDAAQLYGLVSDDKNCKKIISWFGSSNDAPLGARLIISAWSS
jgi:Holliday junction resolvase RusA-like endonuclease